jgi:hypothetical protein
MFALPSHTVRRFSRHWTGLLAHYRQHRNDEHREALVADALRFAGFRLEHDLGTSAYWSEAPLARRVAVLLYLVDRGAVARASRNGRTFFEALQGAEAWVATEPPLQPYLDATLELIAALRADQARRSRSSTD